MKTLRILEGLDGLLYIGGGFLLVANAKLYDISALGGARFARGDVTFIGNSVLSSLDGLQGIRETDTIQFTSNQTLTSTTGLSPQIVHGTLMFTGGNEAIETISFPRLFSVGQVLQISASQSLTTVSLPELDFVDDYLQITENALLETISMARLSKVANLVIADNPSLTTLGGMPALQSVEEDFKILDNTLLPQCEVEEIAQRVSQSCDESCDGNNETQSCD